MGSNHRNLKFMKELLRHNNVILFTWMAVQAYLVKCDFEWS
jgi:hypothetical protein